MGWVDGVLKIAATRRTWKGASCDECSHEFFRKHGPAVNVRAPRLPKRRKDKREQFLIYMDRDLILRIKHAALTLNSYSYLLVEDAVRRAIDDIESRSPPLE